MPSLSSSPSLPSNVFLRACRTGDVKTIEVILREHETLHDNCVTCDDRGCKVFYIKEGVRAAIQTNNLNSIRCLMSLLPMSKAVGHRYHSFLEFCAHQAISRKSPITLGFFLCQITLNRCTCFREASLAWEASETGDMQVFNLVINCFPEYWEDGLRGACAGGHVALFRLALEHCSHTETDYDWVLQCAVKSGNRQIIDTVIDLNPAPDWDFGLYGACDGNHPDLVEYFLAKGATDLNGALELASCVSLDLVQLLIDKGATDFNSALIYQNSNVDSNNEAYWKIILFLIICGADEVNELSLDCLVGLLNRGLDPTLFIHTNRNHYISMMTKNRRLEQAHVCRCLQTFLSVGMLRCMVSKYVSYSVV
jgi:hypothetical protein